MLSNKTSDKTQWWRQDINRPLLFQDRVARPGYAISILNQFSIENRLLHKNMVHSLYIDILHVSECLSLINTGHSGLPQPGAWLQVHISVFGMPEWNESTYRDASPSPCQRSQANRELLILVQDINRKTLLLSSQPSDRRRRRKNQPLTKDKMWLSKG